MTTTTASLERTRASRTQWLITLYAGGGEFCDGYILSIIGVALPLLTAAFSLTAVEAGLLGAASLVGMLFGGLIFGAVTDKFGRQKVYIADLACFVVLSALQFFATEPWQLIVLRTLMGVAVGADLAIAGTIPRSSRRRSPAVPCWSSWSPCSPLARPLRTRSGTSCSASDPTPGAGCWPAARSPRCSSSRCALAPRSRRAGC